MRTDSHSKQVEFTDDCAESTPRDDRRGERVSDTARRSDYAPQESGSSIQDLYRELDGAIVHSSLSTWTLSVYAIHDTGAERWVQLSIAGRDERDIDARDLIVHATVAVRSSDILAAVEAWLSNPRAERSLRIS